MGFNTGSTKYCKMHKTLLNIFSNFFFYLKVQSFRLIMESNFIQKAASPELHDRSNFEAHYRLCAAVFHQWLHEHCPLKGQLSLACRRNIYLCSQKLKRRILSTFGFNRTALRAIQPKLHSMFCTLFEGRIISRRADVV